MKSRRDFLKNIVFTAGIGLVLPNSAVAGYEKINQDNTAIPRQNNIPRISISTIIEIINVSRSYETDEIYVGCLAMDGCTDVFELSFLTNFKQKWSDSLKPGSIYIFHGKYMSLRDTEYPMIYDVDLETFQPIEIFKNEAEVRQHFEEYKSRKEKENIVPF